ncbi:hypothetical protein H632_c1559p1 [Helicosporidium sp. ATCC 50920]|nr:hypothetical protein H632_c1559p1 [Helicosporidium sp. ATCC 50920]|eukprot:KDD74114.1 hypothetical protein H632_c1559p1 [Helicosporidium sp. ATCC 50920]
MRPDAKHSMKTALWRKLQASVLPSSRHQQAKWEKFESIKNMDVAHIAHPTASNVYSFVSRATEVHWGCVLGFDEGRDGLHSTLSVSSTLSDVEGSRGSSHESPRAELSSSSVSTLSVAAAMRDVGHLVPRRRAPPPPPHLAHRSLPGSEWEIFETPLAQGHH